MKLCSECFFQALITYEVNPVEVEVSIKLKLKHNILHIC